MAQREHAQRQPLTAGVGRGIGAIFGLVRDLVVILGGRIDVLPVHVDVVVLVNDVIAVIVVDRSGARSAVAAKTAEPCRRLPARWRRLEAPRRPNPSRPTRRMVGIPAGAITVPMIEIVVRVVGPSLSLGRSLAPGRTIQSARSIGRSAGDARRAPPANG